MIVKVSDGFDFDTQALAIAVTDVNEAPVVTALAGTVGEDGPAFSQNLLAGASDPDAGTQLSVSGLDTTVTTSRGRVLVLGTDYTLNGSTLNLTSQGFARFNSLAAAQSDQIVVHFGDLRRRDRHAMLLTLTVPAERCADACEPDRGPVGHHRHAVFPDPAGQYVPGPRQRRSTGALPRP